MLNVLPILCIKCYNCFKLALGTRFLSIKYLRNWIFFCHLTYYVQWTLVIHCKPISVKKTGISLRSISNREKHVFINWEPCNENRFFPVWKYYSGKTLFWPCTGHVRDCSVYYFILSHCGFCLIEENMELFHSFSCMKWISRETVQMQNHKEPGPIVKF